MIDAALAEKARQSGRTFDGPTTTRNSGIIRVKNESGSDLDRFNVLGLDVPIFTPDDGEDTFLREVTFRGIVPDADHKGKFCVLLEPAPIDRVVRAYVSGVCPVRVDVSDDTHYFADVEDGETGHLNSAAGGAAQILWLEEQAYGYGSDTGEQWAVVRLGNGPDGGLAKVTTLIGAGSSSLPGFGFGDLLTTDGSSYTDTGPNVKLYNSHAKTIAVNDVVQWRANNGLRFVVVPGNCTDLS